MKKSKLLILLAFFGLTLSGCDFLTTTVTGGGSSSSSSESSDSNLDDDSGDLGDTGDGGDTGEGGDTHTYTYEVEITNASELTSLTEDDSVTLSIQVDKKEDGVSLLGYPLIASANDVSILGYDTEIISVSGLTVTALKEGNTSLYVKYLDEATSSSYPVSVAAKEIVSTSAYYSLVGDFYDNPDWGWNGWPDENSIYYLGYDLANPNSMYWERTVTISSNTQDWNASLYVAYVYYDEATSEDVWTLMVGYDNLDNNSTGVLGKSDAGGIQVSWGQTYNLVIDMRGNNPSILVTLQTEGGDTGDTGDTPSEEYDSYYTLVGDFNDASWVESPSEGSNYLLTYSSTNSETKYWERTITTASFSSDGDYYNASFYVANIWYNSDSGWNQWDVVVGYEHVEEGSTGVLGVSKDGGIEVYWDSIYNLIIDMRDTTPSIKVTLIEGGDTGDTGDTGDEGGDTPSEEYDSYYSLVGDFEDASWDGWPEEDSPYRLSYSSTNSNTKYWERSVTIDSTSQSWNASLYVAYVYYDETLPWADGSGYGGDVWELVVGYDNLDSGSSGVLGRSSDGGIQVSWGKTYNLVIDMRGATPSIKVTLIEDEGSGDTGSTDPEIEVSDDFIMGADISSIIEVEEGGGKFYDANGNEKDLISILADNGINYARIRLWNDPYSTSKESYEGGGNDIDRDIQIATRCVAAGMKICLDLHYSDFWAHHGQQYVPKAWTSLSGSTLYDTAASWTTEVLQKFSSAGITIDMIQIGNETNNNQICGLSGTEAQTFFTRCAAAAKTYNPDIKVVIHYAMDQYASTYESYYNALINAGCNFDVLGLSFYPYYHTNETLDYVLSYLNTKFSSKNKEICIMEYSYGWTTTWKEWNTGYGQMRNTFGDSDAATAGYDASESGQAKCIYDINQSVAAISTGIGTFYWEPGWLSVSGTSWASVASNEYYLSNGNSSYNAEQYGDFDVTTWSNQALFDYDGHALDSLKVYNFMKGL